MFLVTFKGIEDSDSESTVAIVVGVTVPVTVLVIGGILVVVGSEFYKAYHMQQHKTYILLCIV